MPRVLCLCVCICLLLAIPLHAARRAMAAACRCSFRQRAHFPAFKSTHRILSLTTQELYRGNLISFPPWTARKKKKKKEHTTNDLKDRPQPTPPSLPAWYRSPPQPPSRPLPSPPWRPGPHSRERRGLSPPVPCVPRVLCRRAGVLYIRRVCPASCAMSSGHVLVGSLALGGRANAG